MIHVCLTFSCWWLLLLPVLGVVFSALLAGLGVEDDFCQVLSFCFIVLFFLLLVGLVGYSIGHA